MQTDHCPRCGVTNLTGKICSEPCAYEIEGRPIVCPDCGGQGFIIVKGVREEMEVDCPTCKPNKKKPYSKPILEEYGTLGDITGAVGNMGKSDNGERNFAKTH